MDPFSSALAAWIAFHAELGVDLETLLLPGATAGEIATLEEAIGHELPADLRALYRRANGQVDPWSTTTEARSGLGDGPLAAMFGHFPLLSLDEALELHRVNAELRADFPTDFEPWGLRPDDPIDPVDWQSSWFTFAAGDAGNGYAVDLAPPRGGTFGQVVQVGPDMERVLVTDSLTSLLAAAAANLDPSEPGRFTYHSPGDGDPSLVSVEFDMDWTWTPPTPPTREELAAAAAESDAQQRARLNELDAFRQWAIGTGSSEADAERAIRTLEDWRHDLFEPGRLDDSFGPVTGVELMLAELDHDLYRRLIDEAEPEPRSIELPAPIGPAFAKYASWRAGTGHWTAEQHAEAVRVLGKPRELPAGVVVTASDGYAFSSMSRNQDGSLTIEDSRLSAPVTFER